MNEINEEINKHDGTEKNPWGLPGIGIPAEVLFHPSLTLTEKVLFGFIQNLSKTEKGCWASNKWLGGLIGVKGQTISNAISNLKKLQFINVEYIILPDGRTGRRIFVNSKYHEIYEKMLIEKYNNINTGILERLYPYTKKDITSYNSLNTKINIEVNNKINKEINNILPAESENTIRNNKIAKDLSKCKNMDKCPYNKIKDMYNSVCTSLPQIKVLSSSRKKIIYSRWKQYDRDLSIFEELFDKASKSKFINGNNEHKWHADFDWLINENNMTKVLEGKYDNSIDNNKKEAYL